MKKITSVLVIAALCLMIPSVSLAGPLTGKTFMIDPGHGGLDPGALGPTGLKEKDVNLRVGLFLRNIMQQYGGATVFMTRSTDTYVTLAGRANLANNKQVNRFVSIHHNSTDVNPRANWTETYYYTYKNTTSKALAEKIQKRLLTATRLPDGGAKPANFAVLRLTKMPAVLTEASFISNRYEEARLRDSNYNWREAYYIYRGIVDHYQF
ncbi:MAG: N-acetylmuramoyl-L-alanine amidase family protein [Bacillota bacterium]